MRDKQTTKKRTVKIELLSQWKPLLLFICQQTNTKDIAGQSAKVKVEVVEVVEVEIVEVVVNPVQPVSETVSLSVNQSASCLLGQLTNVVLWLIMTVDIDTNTHHYKINDFEWSLCKHGLA